MVILLSLKIRQNSHTPIGIRHDLTPSIHQSFFVDLFEDPPDGFHEGFVHSPIGIVDIYPSTQPLDDTFPLLGILEDYRPTLVIIDVYAEVQDLFSVSNSQLFVYLEFDGKSMAIPAESFGYVVAVHGGVP